MLVGGGGCDGTVLQVQSKTHAIKGESKGEIDSIRQ